MADKWRCSLAWRNPTRPVPDGLPRVLLAVLCDRPHPVPSEIDALWREMGPGSGWSVGWQLVEQRPIRRWSQEAKARARVRNLRRRMEEKFPLLAEQLIADELARRPSYYEATA